MSQTNEIEKARSHKAAQESYKKALSYYEACEFKLAEAEFVNVLKPFLSKSSMKNIYVEVEDFKEDILDSMYHLGIIYIQDNGFTYLDNYSKAAAIFQYCHKFSEKYGCNLGINYLNEAYLAELKFLSFIGIDPQVKQSTEVYYQDKAAEYDRYISKLEELRTDVGGMVFSISEFSIERIAERSKIVEEIYKTSTSFFANNDDSKPGLVQSLLQSCYDQLGKSPCEYTIVGLGSLAAGKMTPWSDLEFAIITANEDYKQSTNPDPVKQTQEREYFKNLTKLLHIKVINMGETPLRSVGVESLNNFKTAHESDDWFWDDIIKNGFSFDGPHWYANKTPLGRQGVYKEKKKIKNEDTGVEEEILIPKPSYELILTPKQMSEFQLKERDTISIINDREEVIITKDELLASSSEAEPYMVEGYLELMAEQKNGWFGSDRHLVQALRNVALIDGNESLLDEYRKIIREQDEQKPELIRGRSLEILAEDVDNFQLKTGDEEEGKLFDIKQSIFRVADRVIAALADYYNIKPQFGEGSLTSWEIIDRMESADNPSEKPLLSKVGAQHLREALSIAGELRLATYSHNKGQIEGASTYVPIPQDLTEEERKKMIAETFHITNTEILHYFYQIMIRVQNIAAAFCHKEEGYHQLGEIALQTDSLFDNSDNTKGLVHARFLEYDRAIEHLQKAKEQDQNNLDLLNNLFFLYHKTGKIEDGVVLGEKLLALTKSKHSENPLHPDIAGSYNNLGNAYAAKGEHDKAIEMYDKSLFIRKEAYKTNPLHPDIADSYNNLGADYAAKGEHNKAIEMFDKSLFISKEAYKTNPLHPNIATSYNNLGNAYVAKGEHDKAIDMFDKSLSIRKETYKTNPLHPDITSSYNNLGSAYAAKGEHDKAIDMFDKSLFISKEAYKTNPLHPNIATSYNNLGVAYRNKGEHDKAIEMYDKSLFIRKEAYKTNPLHPDIAASYNNLGSAYLSKGENNKAIEMYDKSLSIGKEAHKTNPLHPDIASSYNNLGSAYAAKGEHDKAIDMFDKSLSIRKETYKTNPNHQNIAASYNNLGNAYSAKGEYENAIKMYDQSLSIMKEAYKTNPNHPDIAMSYNNLGNGYNKIGNFELGLEYSKKSFEIYAQYSNQQDIIMSKMNFDFSLTQLGILSFLEDKIEKSRGYFSKIDEEYTSLDFSSKEFLQLVSTQTDIAYELSATKVCIDCQKALLKLDPGLQYGNHYHNLACFYTSNGDILLANESFEQALRYREVKGSSNVEVEYAQFLIVNRDKLLTDMLHSSDVTIFITPDSLISSVRKHLNTVIRNKASDNGVLKYGKIEQNTVCNMLKDIIVHQNKIITITPQVLAYYLLIKYPEYRDAGETIERLLLAFESKCEQMQDEISFRLLSDAYFSVGNEESGAKYIREAELLLTIDKILTSELQEKGLKKEIEDNMDRIIEIIPKLEASATILVKQQNLEEATKIYEKIFMTYHKLMSAELIEQTAENIEQYKLAADNLATIALLTNNINLFIQLKMGIGAEINTELVEGIGIDIEQVLASEQEIMIRLTQLHTQQAQGVESSNSAQEAVESLGENRDELSDI